MNAKQPDTEEFDFENCSIKVLRNNGKFLVGIEQGKPMGYIALLGFIDILGKPEHFTFEECDKYVLFLFKDKEKDQNLQTLWNDAFGVKNKGASQ